MTGLSERIKQAIYKTGKTQRQLARDIGTTAASINRYISGERIPNAVIIPKLAKACGVSIEWLLTGEGPKREAEELWIPCSKLLPTEEGIYLVTFASNDVSTSEWHKDTQYNRGFDEFMDVIMDDGTYVRYGVVAWCPMPEPYKPKEKNNACD